MDSRVCLEIKALLENLENQVTKAFLESLVLWVHLDHGENVVFLAREESWVQLVCREPRVFLVHLVQMDQRVVLVLLVHLVTWVLQVFRECQERGASLALLGLKVTGEHLGRKDQKVQLETMEHEDSRVLLDH